MFPSARAQCPRHGPDGDRPGAGGAQRGRGFDRRAAGGDDVVNQQNVPACHEAGVGGKCSAQVAHALLARQSDLRRSAAYPAQSRAGEPQVQQARHDPRDFVRLVEAPLDKPRRVQGHGHDQCRPRPWIALLTQRLRDHARAEDPRIRQGTFVLECLHQLRHRKLIGPRSHAPGVRQVERLATRAAVFRISLAFRIAARDVARQATAPAGVRHDRDFGFAVGAQVVGRALTGATAQDAPRRQQPPRTAIEIRVNLAAAHWLTAFAGVRILPGLCPAQGGLPVSPMPAPFLSHSSRFAP